MSELTVGKLTFQKAIEHTELVSDTVAAGLRAIEDTQDIWATTIDTSLSDTAQFCEAYDIPLTNTANCVIVEAKRGDDVWYAACMILGTSRIDVNSKVRKHLEARKISFAPMETAVTLTTMEYGAITPIGLPKEWPVLVDTNVANTDHVIVGSGIRTSKLWLPGSILVELPNAIVMDITKE